MNFATACSPAKNSIRTSGTTLILSQGQESVERNFYVNDDIILPNMKAETLCAVKTVHVAIKSKDIPVHQFLFQMKC